MSKRPTLRGLAVATATVVATGSAALGVSAWADAPSAPSAPVLAAMQESRESAARDAVRDKRAAVQAAADQRVAAARAAERQAAQREAVQREAAQRRAAAQREAAAEREQERASRSSERARDPRDTARAMLAGHGWGDEEFDCLDSLWTKESGWDHTADNPTSSAYGIPQALPGSKMSSAGSDWETNPATQVEWGLGYIAEVYGSPCGAWEHSQANDWY